MPDPTLADADLDAIEARIARIRVADEADRPLTGGRALMLADAPALLAALRAERAETARLKDHLRTRHRCPVGEDQMEAPDDD